MNKIFVLSVFALIVQLSSCSDSESDSRQFNSECLTEAKIDRDTVLKAYDDHYRIKTFDNPAINHFYECEAKLLGIIDKDGNTDFAEVKKGIVENTIRFFKKGEDVDESQVADTAIEKCKHITADHLGEKIIKINNCIIDALVE